jgi:NAD(P)-dependent dehydrogenase (short-subunit alcohol dehydrogenase family)
MSKAVSNRVLVTGGGRGVGEAIVRALAAQGHDVLFTYRSDAEKAAALAADVAAAA